MLSEIIIRDFAIIEEVHLTFTPGFNVLTGETGAGKSIILDAVSLLLGSRAESALVRAGAKMAFVEGVFDLREPGIREAVQAVVEREELEGEHDDMVIITREVKRSGRSVARINGRTATVSIVQEIGEHLVDIHGQGDHLSLLRANAHLDLLDSFAGLYEERDAFAEQVAELRRVRAELRRLIENEQATKERADRLSQMVEEIDAADLKVGEMPELQDEARLLANAELLSSLTNEAYQAVYSPVTDDGLSVTDLTTEAANALAKLVKIDTHAAALASLAEEVSIQVEELARSLADYQENIEFDPLRLQEVELRLDLFKTLMRRYGQDSIEALIEAGQEAAEELRTIKNSDEIIEALQGQEERLMEAIGEAGAALSARRAAAGAELARLVEEELAHLRMERAQFSVAIEQTDDPHGVPLGDYRVAFNDTGIDRVEFMLAPNIGEPFKPMVKIASGGETARIMLALKTVLSRADKTPTLIFDEIDAGIGGRLGAIVGQKLWSLSEGHQVLVVTHLPQLASFGDIHFKVEKHIHGDRTITHVTELGEDLRVSEISQMLGSEAAASRENAQAILAYAQRVKQAAPSA